jgi:hypothetical protein
VNRHQRKPVASGFKDSRDQGSAFSSFLSNPGILDPSNPWIAKDYKKVFA